MQGQVGQDDVQLIRQQAALKGPVTTGDCLSPAPGGYAPGFCAAVLDHDMSAVQDGSTSLKSPWADDDGQYLATARTRFAGGRARA